MWGQGQKLVLQRPFKFEPQQRSQHMHSSAASRQRRDSCDCILGQLQRTSKSELCCDICALANSAVGAQARAMLQTLATLLASDARRLPSASTASFGGAAFRARTGVPAPVSAACGGGCSLKAPAVPVIISCTCSGSR